MRARQWSQEEGPRQSKPLKLRLPTELYHQLSIYPVDWPARGTLCPSSEEAALQLDDRPSTLFFS